MSQQLGSTELNRCFLALWNWLLKISTPHWAPIVTRVWSHSLYVPYPMMWAIMDFHSSLSLAFSNSATSWYLTPLSPIQSFKFAIQSDHCLPLLLFPSIFPVSARFSKPSFLIKCPRNLICFVLISKISFMSVPTLCKTSSFLTLSAPRNPHHLSQKPHSTAFQMLSHIRCC